MRHKPKRSSPYPQRGSLYSSSKALHTPLLYVDYDNDDDHGDDYDEYDGYDDDDDDDNAIKQSIAVAPCWQTSLPKLPYS